MSKKVSVRMQIELPEGVEATREQIDEWLEFSFGATSQMTAGPLDDFEPRVVRDSMIVTHSWSDSR